MPSALKCVYLVDFSIYQFPKVHGGQVHPLGQPSQDVAFIPGRADVSTTVILPRVFCLRGQL